MRKSPKESATDFEPGTEMIGIDGNVWIVVITSKSVRRWKLAKKDYVVVKCMGNYGIFKVHLQEDKRIATIWKNEIGLSGNDAWTLILQVHYERSIMGYDTSITRSILWGRSGREKFGALVVLLQLPEKGDYVVVANDIVSRLSTIGKESILSFTAKIGGNDTVSPVLVTAKNTYIENWFDDREKKPWIALNTAALETSMADANKNGALKNAREGQLEAPSPIYYLIYNSKYEVLQKRIHRQSLLSTF